MILSSRQKQHKICKMDVNIHDGHLLKDWQDIKCNKITRKHFVEVFEVLCSIHEFL